MGSKSARTLERQTFKTSRLLEYFSEKETTELLDLKHKLGFDDPRFHVEDCDLCGNSAFREGYQENLPQQRAFNPAPSFPGYLEAKDAPAATNGVDTEALVKTITDQVLASLSQ